MIALLSAGVFVALASAGAEDPARPTPHLLVVPRSDPGTAALAVANARVVARYRTFTLAEATGGDVADLERAGASLRDDMRRIRIGTTTSDPTIDRPALLDKTGAALRSAGTGATGLAVVQYAGPLKDGWTATVRSTGVDVVSYMAQNGQLVSGGDAALAKLAELPGQKSFVRAVTPYTAADKELPGLARSGPTRAVISTVAGAAGARARARVRAVSERFSDDLTVAGFTQEHVVLDGARLGGLAALGGVVAIEPADHPKPLDERAAHLVAGLFTQAGGPNLGTGYRSYLVDHGFSTNSPEIVDITDDGVDKGITPAPVGSHPDFYTLGSPANASRILYDHEATAADANARDCSGHGTNVASIATGYNAGTGPIDEDAQHFNYGLGIAPYARLGATKIFNCAGAFDLTTSLAALHSAAYASGARISNNSWGSAVGGAYNTRSQELDSIVRDAQPATPGSQAFTEVVAAGNSGARSNTTDSPGTAKNVITVGASESVRPLGAPDGCGVTDAGASHADDVMDSSSRGPTDDGRIKPDVVAPGSHVTGAQPRTGADYNGTGTCNPQFPAAGTKYALASGTSQAAPEVTGFAALVREWYRKNLGHGSAYPTPAMLKAVMANTADDMAGGNDGDGAANGNVPTQTQGWGRVDLGNVLDGTTRQVRDQKTLFKATGNGSTTYYDVADGAKPVRVTLAWTDAVGPTTGDSFVNDLNLEVTAGGTTYKGNVLANGRSVAGGSADPRNNLENVFLPAGATGRIKVRVIAANIAGNGVPGNGDTTDQDYALLVSNAGSEQSSGAVLTAGARKVIPGGDGDSYVETGESFTVTQQLRNVGNAPATGITGTLRAQAGLTPTTRSATWPDLATNASAVNSPMFAATLSATGGPCGLPRSTAIMVSSSAGPLTIPFELVVGHPTAAVTPRTSTDVPKAIPDDNPNGVASRIDAGETGGSVSDVNVKIGRITHTFDGDLVIDLTSPEGTTVRLANRVGGSGDDFVNTVFDDEATTPISSGVAPFTQSFRPLQRLSAFDGQIISGTWTLRITDLAPANAGTLQSWGTSTRGHTC